jgi:hypothetical protein
MVASRDLGKDTVCVPLSAWLKCCVRRKGRATGQSSWGLDVGGRVPDLVAQTRMNRR